MTQRRTTDLMFSSVSDEWETPQDIYDHLHAEFDFQIDLAATAATAKCASYFTKETDALSKDWRSYATRGWLNPPYSRSLCKHFIEKAARQRQRGFLTVLLLPARTDTQMFHTYIYDTKRWRARTGVEIRFLSGRVKFSRVRRRGRFVIDREQRTHAAPFPSMVVIFRPKDGPTPC